MNFTKRRKRRLYVQDLYRAKRDRFSASLIRQIRQQLAPIPNRK